MEKEYFAPLGAHRAAHDKAFMLGKKRARHPDSVRAHAFSSSAIGSPRDCVETIHVVMKGNAETVDLTIDVEPICPGCETAEHLMKRVSPEGLYVEYLCTVCQEIIVPDWEEAV